MATPLETKSELDLTALDAKLDHIQEQMSQLVERQRYQSELIDEMWPIMNEVVKSSTETLAELEQKGYFAFARESGRIVERIVENYGEDDVRQLGESIVGILDTVKNVTQPEVLAVANDATGALSQAQSVKPTSLFGMLKASRDRDVKYGMAIILEILRQIGRNSRRSAGRASTGGAERRQRLEARLGPSRGAADRPARKAERARPRAAAAPAAPQPAAPEVDPQDWTREIGEQIAAAEGVELTEEHWKVIEFARADFFEKKVSPNIRRMTTGLELTTKDIYRLFPKAPARTVCEIAGIPKPAGCI